MTLSSYAVPIFGGGFMMAVCYSLGRMDFSIFWISILVVLNIVTSKLWKERERRVIALQQAALREKEVILAHMKDLPAWVQFPDTERVEWMNKVIYQLWPYIGEYSKNFIKEIIEPQVKAHLPSIFKSFRFDQIDMGDIPLRVGGIKVYTENVGRDRIIMDMDVAYAGDCEFVVSVGAFKGGLRQMQFKGKLRAVLKPLVPKPPLIGGVSVFLLDEPTIDFDLTGLGEFVELPGLIGAVRNVVRAQVGSICVLPNEIVVPLMAETDVVKLYFPEPDGILRIHIKAARNLENKDTFMRGKSDPYASISVGSQNYKTKVIDNNLNPVWNEYFEAVVDQSSGQKMILECFDQDPGSNDEFLGRITLDISMVRDKFVIDQWMPLEGVKHGEVHLALFWLDLSTDVKLLGHEDEWEQPFIAQNQKNVALSDAVLLIYVDNVSNLPYAKRNIEPSPYVEISVGNDSKKTFVRPKTCNPLFQQKFVFFVNNVEHQSVKIEAKDSTTNDHPLGDVIVPIRSIMKENRLELYQQTFHLSLGPHLAPAVLTIRLRVKTFMHLTSGHKLLLMFLKLGSEKKLTKSTSVDNTLQPANHQYMGSFPNTKQTIIPLLSNGGDLDDGDGAAWRNATFSSGAETIHSRPNVGLVQRAQRSRFFNFGKLNKRRSASTHFDGYLGKIQLTISYIENEKKLFVTIHSAEQLHSVNFDNVADPYVSLRVLKMKMSVGKKKTPIFCNTLNPIMNEILDFDIQPDDLPLCSLAVDVKDSCNYGWLKRPPVLGHILFDLSRLKKDEALTQWFILSPPPSDRISLSSVPVSRRS